MILENPAPVLNAALLRWLDELTTEGVFSTDAAFRIRSWNRWLVRHTGREQADVLGQPLMDVLPELASRGVHRYYQAALAGETSILAQPLHQHLIRLPGREGIFEAMPQSARIAPLQHDGVIVGTITLVEDVSERVIREAEMRRQILAAEEARAIAENTLRIRDEFLTTLSHEIRTPLNAVIGWTKLLLMRPGDAATLQRALTAIDRNAAAQARLIEDMLDMARIVSGKLRLDLAVLDLASAASAAIDVVAPAATAKALRIVPDFGSGPQRIVADADRIQQIVWNVLSNAVKFTPSGGRVDVSIASSGGRVRLIVADSGEGIAPDFLPYVFDRFRQANGSTSRTEGGLGLGLALVRQLVEMHGGAITVESPGKGRGTVVTITFPEAGGTTEIASPALARRV